MDAIVLAGGYATRLWPITKDRAKPLLPVAGRPIVEPILEDLDREERISSVYISTNKRFEKDFNEYLGSKDFRKPEIAVENTKNEEEKPGTLGAISDLKKRKNIDEDTFIIAGDNLFSFEISDFLDFHEKNRDTVSIAAYDVGSKQKAKQYGIINLENKEVTDFQEKPENPKSTLASIACYMFPKNSLKLLDKYLEDGQNPDAPGFFIEWLYKRQKVNAYTFDGMWFDIGTKNSYIQANTHLLDNSLIEKNVKIKNSEIKNSYIMEGSNIKNSKVENSIIFGNTKIENSNIKNSIIDEKTKLEKTNFKQALTGKHTEITGTNKK